MAVFVPRFLWTLAVLGVLVALGTLGYVWIEEVPVADALYMTVITLTAVGYEEVFELSPRGRTFTIFLLLSGISWLGLCFANITAFIVELDLKHAIERRRNMKEIAKMKDHVVICGAGRTGRQVAQEIESVTNDFVIIERDPVRIEELAEYVPNAHVIEGDATHDHVLLEAGLLSAKGLITCLSADTDNLFVCLSARDLAAQLTIVARAYEEESIDKLYRAGANQVVSPNVSSAIRMAAVLLRPSVVSFLDIATRSPDLSLRVEQTIMAGEFPARGEDFGGSENSRRDGPHRHRGPQGAAIWRPVRLQPDGLHHDRRWRRCHRAGCGRADQESEGLPRLIPTCESGSSV
jgi:voltage-gated potassium channel